MRYSCLSAAWYFSELRLLQTQFASGLVQVDHTFINTNTIMFRLKLYENNNKQFNSHSLPMLIIIHAVSILFQNLKPNK